MDTIIHEQGIKIDILQGVVTTQYTDFNNLLKVERDKLKLQKRITFQTDSISNSHKEENKSLQKKVNRMTWKTVGLVFVAIVEAVIIIAVSL